RAAAGPAGIAEATLSDREREPECVDEVGVDDDLRLLAGAVVPAAEAERAVDPRRRGGKDVASPTRGDDRGGQPLVRLRRVEREIRRHRLADPDAADNRPRKLEQDRSG